MRPIDRDVHESVVLVDLVHGAERDEIGLWFAYENLLTGVQTKVSETAFGMTSVQDRTVLAIYFDKNKRVADKAVYTAKDGKVFTIEGRKTPSYGQDKNFIDSLIASV